MVRNSRFLKLAILILMAMPLLGCFTLTYFFDVAENPSGQGTISHLLTFPGGNESGSINTDAYTQKLIEQGWENIKMGVTEDGLNQIEATYSFDFAAGKGLPADFAKSTTLSITENEFGDPVYKFDVVLDYSKMQDDWNNLKKSSEEGASIDLGEWMGGTNISISTEEYEQLVKEYGEPEMVFSVRLPGNTPIDVTGPWQNAKEYMAGETDVLTFLWTIDQNPITSLSVSRTTSSEESQPAPAETIPEGLNIDENKIDMPCGDYCLSLDPIGFWVAGGTYPNCLCDCGLGNSFVGLECVSNAKMCTGEGMRLLNFKDGGSICTCTDPNKKFDQEKQTCIPLDGGECNRDNHCDIAQGENCSNCSDCGCSFAASVNSQYNDALSCNPSSANADIYGCVFEIPNKQEQLNVMREEWNQCRDAWAILNLAKLPGEVGYKSEVLGTLSDLPQVQVWQQKSGCIPIGDVVVGREAADPVICLMRYCDRIKTGIHQLELQVNNQTPVIHGPGIKINPISANVPTTPAQVPQFDERITIFGDRPASLISPLGVGSVHSQYELNYDPNIGMEVFLFEGTYIHTYIDPATGTARQESLSPGQMLYIDLLGVPILREAFDPASRTPWWNDTNYLVACPENASQQGADCFCNPGFEVDPELERCITGDAYQEAPQVSAPSVAPAVNNGLGFPLMLILSLCCCSVGIVVIVLVIIFVRRKNNNNQGITLNR